MLGSLRSTSTLLRRVLRGRCEVPTEDPAWERYSRWVAEGRLGDGDVADPAMCPGGNWGGTEASRGWIVDGCCFACGEAAEPDLVLCHWCSEDAEHEYQERRWQRYGD